MKELERRMVLWEEGDINELSDKGIAIQNKLVTSNATMNIGKLSSKFKQLMQKGNVNGAFKLLTNNML